MIKMKYIISTLGCKVNQYETQAMETILHERGHESAAPGELADAVIVNTCAVTAESERKSRQLIRRLKEENPSAVLAVSGCYSQAAPEDAERLGADVIFGSNDRTGLVAAVERVAAQGGRERNIDEPFKRRYLERLSAGAVSGRTRAILKIQDGCVNFCSYCIIPYTRGRLRSLPVEEAVAECRRLYEEGYKELVFTGIEIAAYGVDLPDKPGLARLISECAGAAPGLRIRLGSLEPTVVTEELCRELSGLGALCPHFHLSLQSGCDSVLKRMNRKYDTARFFRSTELLRQYFPHCAITCDLICGFPGESEAEHSETLSFISRCGFSDMHVFPYSRRPGTPADTMPGQLERAVKERRCKEARAIGARMHEEYMSGCLGRSMRVLFERQEQGFSLGHSDSYQLVKVAGEGLRGQTLEVCIRAMEGDCLFGELV